MIVLTKPCVLIYNDGTVQAIIKENSGKVYPSANSEYAEFDTESEMNDFIEKNKLEIPDWVLNPELQIPEEMIPEPEEEGTPDLIPEETDDPDSLIQELI
ncbi:hypothetical protein [Bacteroides nordii]|uniref:hypothetical protein n=1 Tax=Bacteroides nordii TaxID=291645 RepID=UPI00352043FC